MKLKKAFGRSQLGFVSALGLALLAGCRTSGTGQEGGFSAPPQDLKEVTNVVLNQSEVIDRIRPGDSLTVTLNDYNGQPPQIFTDQVKQDGTVKVMLQDKSFVAADKFRGELEKEIHDFYVPAYYQQMTVSVQITTQTRFYFMDGEVKSPGRQVYLGSITVLGAVASAGGFTDFANKRNVLLTHPDGRIEHINWKKALEHPELDRQVLPSDKIYVKRRILW